MISAIDTVIVFSDAATSSKANLAIGAFFFLTQSEIKEYIGYTNQDLMTIIKKRIIYKKYASKKSTWSEIKTAIDALNTIQHASHVEMYTDCQSLCDLLGRRREKLEKNNFLTQSGKLLQNATLYRELFAIADKFQMKIFKMKGHNKLIQRVSVHTRLFAVLDKLSRKQLRFLLE